MRRRLKEARLIERLEYRKGHMPLVSKPVNQKQSIGENI